MNFKFMDHIFLFSLFGGSVMALRCAQTKCVLGFERIQVCRIVALQIVVFFLFT